LTGLSTEMIEKVFVDWTNRSNVWLMEMVTTLPKISQVNFWTELNNGKHVKIEY
jgi:hypothetical protein